MPPLRSLLLDLPWLDHGFGTRQSEGWLDGQPVARLRQVHSDRVVRVLGQPGDFGEGDVLVTDQPGIWLEVRTADCFPVILADPVRQAVALVHAGWRGVAGRILKRSLEHMGVAFGTHRPDVLAVIGPGIEECCFEVGPEVARQFGKAGRIRIDLVGEIYRQLEGVSQVDRVGACTRCFPALYYSFRREAGSAGRMVTAVRKHEGRGAC